MIATRSGETLQLVEIVRCNQDGPIGAPQLGHDVAKLLRPYRIEPVGWLIENQNLVVTQQRLRQAEALQIPL